MPDDSIVYLALSQQRLSDLVTETLDLLSGTASVKKADALLERWVALQLADTRLAILPGTTTTSAAHLTELLAESRQRAEKVTELTEDLAARDKRIAELQAENERLSAAFEASGADLSSL